METFSSGCRCISYILVNVILILFLAFVCFRYLDKKAISSMKHPVEHSVVDIASEAIDDIKEYTQSQVTILKNKFQEFEHVPLDILEYFANKLSPEENRTKFVILLIGKTGVGKSTTGNAILGKPAFRAATSASSVTSETTLGTSTRFGKDVIVVDTPGLHDTNQSNSKVLNEIAKCYSMTSPGFHAIILVTRIGRFTKEDEDTVEFFVERFGDALYRFLIIVFTGKERLEMEDQSLEDYIGTLHENSRLKRLINTIHHDRILAFSFNNPSGDVKKLLDRIDFMSQSGKYHYSNKMYKDAEKVFQTRLQKEIEKIRKEKEKEVLAIIEDFKAKFNLAEEKWKTFYEKMVQDKMAAFEKKFRENTRQYAHSEDSWLLRTVRNLLNGQIKS